ncbi:Nephrin-like protein [Dinothrombium tinctorium]|uniref:Nephrin-like protein n=1 Tax=Dinothrombium tinctorium TaxID=1965070 RepID=A0A443QS25_9ACAR|nr:Nephrin-like protein [Dinothrombium tinctorium]
MNLICLSEGGNPRPKIFWWKGSNIIDDTFSYTEKGTKNLLSLSLKRSDYMTSFSCQAFSSNLSLPIFKTVTIELNLKPTEVKIVTKFTRLLAGKTVKVVCEAKGSKPAASIEWLKGEQKIVGSENISDDGFVTTSVLSFIPSYEDNKKSLTCIARNPRILHFDIRDMFVMNVEFAPVVSLVLGASIQRQDILQGSDIYFECNFQIGVFVNNQTLLIENVRTLHSGSYQCWAVNSQGRGESEVVKLNRIYYGVDKEEVLVLCELNAEPTEVTFHWSFNESEHEKWNSVKYTTKGTTSTAFLTIKEARNYGLIYCWGQNEVGVQAKPCVFYLIPAGRNFRRDS